MAHRPHRRRRGSGVVGFRSRHWAVGLLIVGGLLTPGLAQPQGPSTSGPQSPAILGPNATVTYGATPEQLAAALAQKDQRLIALAREAGVTEGQIIGLARRMPGGGAKDLDQALRDLEYLVGVAIKVIGDPAPGTDQGDLVEAVFRRVAERSAAQDYAGAAREVDAGLAELDRRAAAQADADKQQRIAMLERGVQVAMLNGDAAGAAGRLEASAGVREPGPRPAWTGAFGALWDRYYEEGRDKGINLSLEVAIAMAGRMSASARDADESGDAGNLLGTALSTLGARESGTARLEAAVAAYRAALAERTRERVPLNWATSFGNEGVALKELADQRGDRGMAETALRQITTAFETLRDSGNAVGAAYFERQIPLARAVVARLGGERK